MTAKARLSFGAALQDTGGTCAAPEATSTNAPLWIDEHGLRAAQLDHLVDVAARRAPLAMAAALAFAAGFWTSEHRFLAATLGLTIAGAALVPAIVKRFGACRRLSARGTTIARGLAIGLAAITGLAWASAFVLVYPTADGDHRLVLVAAVLVTLADLDAFGAVRSVALAHVVPVLLAAAVGFAMTYSLIGFALSLATLLYGSSLLSRGALHSAAAAGAIGDHIRLAAQHETIHALLLDFDDDTSDWLWRTDAAGRLTSMSGGVVGSAGLHLRSEGGDLAAIFAKPGGRTADGARAVLAAIAARKPFRNRLVEIRSEAEPRWWRMSGKPLYDAAGAFAGYRGVGQDVTGARDSESRIAYLANFDALTGFANRSSFQAYVTRQGAAAALDGHCRALLCLDLDGFKSVNDSLGHEGGDEILKQVAARLTACVPADTFVARLGGDEFALWLPATSPAKAMALAEKLIVAIGEPYVVHDLQADVGASIGIALAPKHATTPDELLVKADLALYRAKADGKGRVCLFEEAFEIALIERRKLEGDLKLALARGEFLLHYQPLVDLVQGQVVSFEALIRWRSPERGFVSPAAFIPAAESGGLIGAVGRWVLLEACRTAATWPRDIRVAVNVSPPHVRSPDFLQDVTMALKLSGLHPSRLEIEVTEGVFLDKSDSASAALQTLRTRGVKIALDDFGTGYSSLNYLIDFPVDKIKIDRSFVTDLVTSHANQAIVDAMLGLARKLSIRVTAEGVETKEQARALKVRRCDDIQGYLLSKPRPAADVPDMIASVPALFREVIPTHMDSPLAMALATRKAESEQAA